MTSTDPVTAEPHGCCTPLGGGALSAADAVPLAHTLKALSDPTRLRLLSLVSAAPGQEACVCDLTEPVGLSQPTVSHHLKVLVDAHLMARDKRGVWSYYSVVPGALDRVSDLLSAAARPGDADPDGH